jgi:hypothetical protein
MFFFETGSGEKPGFGEGTNQRSNPNIETRSTKQIPMTEIQMTRIADLLGPVLIIGIFEF